jgi:hypothetical protein
MSLLLLLLSPAYPLLLLLSTWCCCWAAVPGAGPAVSSGLQPSQPRQGQLLLYKQRTEKDYFLLKIVILNFFDLILANLHSFVSFLSLRIFIVLGFFYFQ